MSTQIDRIDGGYDTARVSAAEADRAIRDQRDQDALAYLARTGNGDLAEVLGLVPSAPPRAAYRDRIGRDRTTSKPKKTTPEERATE